MSTLTDTGAPPRVAAPKRTIGVWLATALVVGNMVGSGVFLLPAALAGEAGPISIVALALTGVGAILLALVFAGLGRAHPATGGPYAYVRSAFGDFAGFWTAWGYWIAAWVGNAAITIAFVSYLATFWGDLATHNWLAAGVAVALVWVLTAVNVLGARESGWVQLLTTVLKFVPLAAIGIVGLFYVEGGNFTPFAPESGGGWLQDWHVNAAATLALWAFIGLESATVPAGETKDPDRTIPRATILGTLATTLLYLVALVALLGILPRADLAQSGAPFADAADQMWSGGFLGLSWGDAIALVALAATLGCLNGWILLTARVSYAAARDGLFPRSLARLDGPGRTPVVGLLVGGVLISGLLVLNYSESKSAVELFEQVVLLATLTTLVPYAFSAAAQIALWLRERERFSPRVLVRDIVVASLAFGYSVWAIWGSGEEIIAKGFMLLLAGIPVYLWMTWRRSAEKPLTVPEEWTRESAPSVSAHPD